MGAARCREHPTKVAISSAQGMKVPLCRECPCWKLAAMGLRGELPGQITSFIGRASTLELTRQLLAEHRLVSLIGRVDGVLFGRGAA